ncbi:hypothetical protein EGI11_10690 [Chryseobacterium sp. H3056]|jgi:hypothetical protein|uniref:Uncharacterized protein n=1 Tax=Kaistella daneshvariae TaxID=2487074 RepID=A0A3N0WST6_9FLAO|nr:hypothetical protein [Kaistella daneshvariae]ROI08112.1 hypothetical protein EGI11_10690 [Kaistella daneshvariae]
MDKYKGYIETENPFAESKIKIFKNAIKQSRYFLEAIEFCRAHNRNTIPMLSWENDKRLCYLFNLNMFQYILDNGLFEKVLETNSVYDKKFEEGYASFDKTLRSLPVNSHKTWNGLLTIYRNIFKKELLDEKTVFSDEEVQQAFYQSGRATRYWKFEEDNSIILANYFMMESSGSNAFPYAKNPIINKYDTVLPDTAKTESKVSVKVEFIILKELGAIDELVEKRTSKEVAVKIAEKINKKYNSRFPVSTRNIHNIQNILTADIYKPDYTNPKSAYKKQNIKKALLKLHKMDVSLEQCKHLNDLKFSAPQLFE